MSIPNVGNTKYDIFIQQMELGFELTWTFVEYITINSIRNN